MGIHDVSINTLAGSAFDLSGLSGQVVLLVNVASKCGLTPQYTGLEKVHETYASRGFSVVGAPCNQFMGQEPGTAEEIEQFCSTTYGVTFPLLEKIEVNGEGRHPLYQRVVDAPDSTGHTGDIRWNFEKFLIGPDGEVAARFGPQVEPDAPEVITAIESLLPAG
jgi:glutathione peroxidase